MNKITTLFFVAVAASVLAGCEPQTAEPAYNSFELDIAGGDSKTHWDAAGFWWDDGDVVYINGTPHTLHAPDATHSTWYTQGSTVGAEGGKFYVAYPGGNDSYDDAYNTTDHTFGPVSTSGTQVPMAISGSNNRLTMYPCVAVIHTNQNSVKLKSTTSGNVVTEGASIDIANKQLVGHSTVLGNNKALKSVSDGDGRYYIIVPIEGSSWTGKLTFGTGKTASTTNEITLETGKMYSIDK